MEVRVENPAGREQGAAGNDDSPDLVLSESLEGLAVDQRQLLMGIQQGAIEIGENSPGS